MAPSWKLLSLTLVIGALAQAGPRSAALGEHIIYVNASATGADDGTSWLDAYTDLQDALCEASAPDACAQASPCQIWVAAGVYKPDGGTGGRYATFQMLNNATLYGGFAGWETALPQRDWEINQTILSGDLNGDDGDDDCPEESACCVEHEGPGCDDAACELHVCELAYTPCCRDDWDWDYGCTLRASVLCCGLPGVNKCENSYHVVTASGTDDSAILDGLAIVDGNADGDIANQPEQWGGGLFNEGGSPTIRNCTFRGHRAFFGGGMYNFADASPLLTNCLFVENRARMGGAISATHSELTLIDSAFTDNFAIGGAAIWTHIDNGLTMIGCAFDRNSSGGTAVSADSTLVLAIGCSFTENKTEAIRGGAIHINGFNITVLVIDCDFIGNSASNGAGAVSSENASLTMEGCTFIGNSATGIPGAVDASWGNVILRNCLFVGNYPSAVSTDFGSAAIVNCGFVGNDGGGTSAYEHAYGSVWLTNSTFAGNRTDAYMGRALSGRDSTMTVTNCILWGNSNSAGIDEESQINVHSSTTLTINNSIVSGWTGLLGGEGNSGHDPLFVQEGHWEDPGTPDDILDDVWIDGDYHLLRDSTSINTGDLDAPFLTDTDLDDHARVLCDEVDRGAYEFGIGDYDCDQVVNLTDFAAWQACMTGPDGGPYDPGCEVFDFGADDHIDLTDFAGFQRAFTGGHP